MKNFFRVSVLVLLLACPLVKAGEFDLVTLYQDNIATNATANQTTTSELSYVGLLDSIVLDISGHAGPSVTVVISTASNSVTRSARTLYSKAGVTADTVIAPRFTTVSSTGGATTNYARYPLIGDYITLQCYAANTNEIIDVKATLVIEK